MALFLSRYLRKRQRGQDAIHRAPVARFHQGGGFQPALVVKVWQSSVAPLAFAAV